LFPVGAEGHRREGGREGGDKKEKEKPKKKVNVVVYL
jgi:hypothetical protein